MTADHQDIIAPATANTLPGLFRERVARSPDAIAYREWDSVRRGWRSFAWREMAQLVARYLDALGGIGFTTGDRVAIQIKNGTDWVAFDIAAMAAGFIPVPLYAHDSLANTVHVLANSGAKLVFLESIEEWQTGYDVGAVSS